MPAVFGSLDEADQLLETVKSTGRKYMMFETSAFHDECHAMRQIYQAGGFGKLVYSEGEYLHDSVEQIPSFRNWRVGLPPQWYPTHATAYYVCVSGGSFTEVTCMGMPSIKKELQPANNRYKNPFGTEIALLAHQRRGHVADGHELGHARPGSRGGPGLRPARLHGGHALHRARRRSCRTWSVPRCRRVSSRAVTAARTATS